MCYELFILMSCSGYQALPNTEVYESVTASVIEQSRPRSDEVRGRYLHHATVYLRKDVVAFENMCKNAATVDES